MPELGRFARELRARLWKMPVEREVDVELRYHLEMRIAENLELGMDPATAREAALRRFGDVDEITAACRVLGRERDRAMRFNDWMAELVHDARHAARQLRLNPVFATVAALTIALGIGTSTSIFGIVDAVLLRPLPYPEPARLVRVWEANPRSPTFGVSEPNYLDWHDRARSFAAIGAWTGARVSLTGEGEPELLRGAAVTPSLFDVLRVAPAFGRAFVESDARPDAMESVVLISDALWRRRFSGDRRVIGTTVTLDGAKYQIIGVMPRGFDFPGRRDFWLPLAPSATSSRSNHILSVAARLAPGVTVERAVTEMRGVANALAREYPASNASWSTTVRSFGEWIVTPELRARVLVLVVAVALLLFMACVNVANLLVVRGTVRQHDMGLRAALGAARARLVRQLLTENLVLAALGGSLGIAFAFVVVPVVRAVAADSVPRLDAMRVDARVLVFGVAASALTGMLFGLIPALRASRIGLAALLRRGARQVNGSRTRSALVVTSVALATVLLVGAALVAGSFLRLTRVDPGFRTDGVLTAAVTLPSTAYGDDARREAFWREVVQRLDAVPSVRAAGATNIAPFSGGNTGIPFTLPGGDAQSFLQADWRSVTPGYFAALGVTLKRGRLIDERDTRDASPVIVITERMARHLWPSDDAIGKQIRVQGADKPLWTVVGVVGDFRDVTLDGDPRELMYLSYQQVTSGAMWLAVRADGDPTALSDAVRREVWAVDKSLPVSELQPLARLVSDAVAQPRLTALIFGLFASAALVLAVVGVYGVIAYDVGQRTREIGVRLALGARPSSVLALVVGRGLRLAIAGIGLGVVTAAALSRYLSGILFGVAPTDALTYALAAGVLAIAAASASAIPAIVAARLDPARALRQT